jgi:NAD(P)-dependent dehydrogenase (short-subunit alcohol dehydrogenase family)
MMWGPLDTALDRSAAGYGRLGYALRSPAWQAPPRMDGRIVCVTGAAGGIGLAAAEGFARLGAEVWLVTRTIERGEAARAEIIGRAGNDAVHVAACDLADLADIARLPQKLARPLDVLVHNASVLSRERALSPDGIELTFATNVLGQHLLTSLIAPDRPGQVVFVSSGGMYLQRLHADDLQSQRGDYDGVKAYARSKRAEVVLAELHAERLAPQGVHVNAMHPGWCDTPGLSSSLPVFRRLARPLLRSAEQGADTIVWLGAGGAGQQTGAFWHDRRRRPTHLLGRTQESRDDRERLLAECERLIAPALLQEAR